jgi:hypothetical protein
MSLLRSLRTPFALVATVIVVGAVAAGPMSADAGARVAVGAYIKGADLHPGLIRTYARRVGRTPAIVNIYKDWGHPVFEAHQLREIWRQGAVTMVTLEPWGVSLRSVARGGYDRYVEGIARAARRWHRPVFLRFAHEMNGNWYPWGVRTPAHTYKAAWRHLVRVFRRVGADNVKWVWTPYASDHFSLAGRYPGNAWVDWVGLDGFNWGGPQPWLSFSRIFASPYRVLTRLSNAPVMLAEIASSEAGGNKAAWLSSALNSQIPHMRQVRALVWWSADSSRGDFRVNSSHSALRALRHALKRRDYQVGRRELARSLGR